MKIKILKNKRIKRQYPLSIRDTTDNQDWIIDGKKNEKQKNI